MIYQVSLDDYLLSALAGPLLIVCLVLIFGPCVAKTLIAFVKDWVGTVQLIVLRQQYQSVRDSDRAEV